MSYPFPKGTLKEVSLCPLSLPSNSPAPLVGHGFQCLLVFPSCVSFPPNKQIYVFYFFLLCKRYCKYFHNFFFFIKKFMPSGVWRRMMRMVVTMRMITVIQYFYMGSQVVLSVLLLQIMLQLRTSYLCIFEFPRFTFRVNS